MNMMVMLMKRVEQHLVKEQEDEDGDIIVYASWVVLMLTTRMLSRSIVIASRWLAGLPKAFRDRWTIYIQRGFDGHEFDGHADLMYAFRKGHG